MTITPINFTMITRFRCAGETIEFSSYLAKDFFSAWSLLGFPPILEKYGGVPISYFIKHSFRASKDNYILIPEQRTWDVILVILASTITANGRDSIKLDVLTSLRYINKVRDYAWGSLGLAYAYHYFTDVF